MTVDTAVPAIALESVTCTFAARERGGTGYTAVRDVTLRVQPGEFVSVVGPTGCGKSTMLNAAAGLIQPSSGEVRVHGKPLQGINARAGYMFQADALMPWRTALENVAVGLEFRSVPPDEARERAMQWLRRVGLGGFEHRYPHHLSGGMRKRVALAQMLILDRPILLMDEPFSALDVQTRQLMENELLSAGPASHPIGEFSIDVERPRDVAEVRLQPRFLELHAQIWHAMKLEVLRGYEQQKRAVPA